MKTTIAPNKRFQLNFHAYQFSFHSDIFNLPLPALWTAVLGEYNRHFESGHEQRISIDKIITHSHYSHFDHDIGKNVHTHVHLSNIHITYAIKDNVTSQSAVKKEIKIFRQPPFIYYQKKTII